MKLVGSVFPELFEEKVFPKQGGQVKHFIKSTSKGFEGFGEAYFSSVEDGSISGWKRHRRVSCNLGVLKGNVRFVLLFPENKFVQFKLSADDSKRLFIPPNFWYGFQGTSSVVSMIINIIDETHDPDEQDQCELDQFDFDWIIK